MEEVGIVTGGARPGRIEFVAKKPVRVGEFVSVETEDGAVIYMVEGVENSSKLLSEAHDYMTAEEARRAAASNPRDKIRIASARAFGLADELVEGRRIYPSLAPEPGAPVRLAGDELLRMIYTRGGERWADVGSLLRREGVRVSIDINAVASRHLAVLAATGKGKSNFLALLAKKISERHGTMVIFDYHAEYHELRIPGKKIVTPKINPRSLTSDELADLLGIKQSATRQRATLAKAFTREVREADDLWQELLNNLERIAEKNSNYQTRLTAQRLIEIVNRALALRGSIFDLKAESPLDALWKNAVNVLDLSEFTEQQAQVIVDRYLDELLQDRKSAMRGGRCKFSSPLVAALEEAHVFIPSGRETGCSETIARIAREGRKFGLSLIVVSQRPSRLNADIVSQMGSLAISGLLHPRDRAFIEEVTDEVSEELGASLPSFNPGEMILAGQFVPAPALVKVDHVKEKVTGRDLDAVGLWLEERRSAGGRPVSEELVRL